MEEDKKKNTVLSFEELLSRSSAAEKNEKFVIAANYYFVVLSRHFDTLSKNKAQFKEVVEKFIFSIILLNTSALKEKLLNFAIQNDNLNIFPYKPIFERMLNYEFVYLDDIRSLMGSCPPSYATFNYERAVFEHNISSIARCFSSISFNSIEKFLKMKIDVILDYTFKLSALGVIKAGINEKTKYIFFEGETENFTGFDKQIQNFCLKAKKLGEYVKNK